MIAWFVAGPAVEPAAGQAARPVPYPVIPSYGFNAALERGTRDASGAPGAAYWTNTADYILHATLSPDTRMLRGEAEVRYHNQSPDALAFVYVHLRQNLHEAGAVRNRPQRLTDGMEVSRVAVDGRDLIERRSSRSPGYTIDGTLMRIDLPAPLAPGDSTTFHVAWSFAVPEAGAPRIGQDGEVFFVGYWYPQLAVYDDVNGWKAEPYQGNGEFYMGYGTYDVHLTLPAGWLVGATGVLQNPEAVLSEQTRARLTEAARGAAVVPIVTPDDRKPGTSTAEGENGVLTWHFTATDVRDFAFGASDRYVWDATTADAGDRDGDGVADTSFIHAFYRPDREVWGRSAEFAKFSIEWLSEAFLPYPYPHMTTVEGVIGGGMEYPMITHIGGARTDRSLFGVTFHEIGHMWFPMVVGQDEKQFAWMDEGLTSFNTAEASGVFFNDAEVWDPGRQSYYRIAGTDLEVESMRHADDYPTGTVARGIASYNKPAVALNALRGLVGEERFWEAYRAYSRRWMYRHPQPYDLFNTFEDVLGEDLDWFWTPMFFETWTLDQGVGGVERTSDGVMVTVEDHGLTPMPAPVRVTYEDGTTAEQTVPVETWLEGARSATLRFDPGPVVRVEIDPTKALPDVDRSNNTWAN